MGTDLTAADLERLEAAIEERWLTRDEAGALLEAAKERNEVRAMYDACLTSWDESRGLLAQARTERDAAVQERERLRDQLVARLTAEEWMPGNHCPFTTKHGQYVYEYCRLTRGHDGDHVMDYVKALEADRKCRRLMAIEEMKLRLAAEKERDDARAEVERLRGDYGVTVQRLSHALDAANDLVRDLAGALSELLRTEPMDDHEPELCAARLAARAILARALLADPRVESEGK